jgi:hypothetical protein
MAMAMEDPSVNVKKATSYTNLYSRYASLRG